MSRVLFLLLTLLITTLPKLASADPLTINGRVVTASGKPLPFAAVFIQSPYGIYLNKDLSDQLISATTDANGQFTVQIPNAAWFRIATGKATGCFASPVDIRNCRGSLWSFAVPHALGSNSTFACINEDSCKALWSLEGGHTALLITTSASKQQSALNLDIPAPGAPMLLHIQDDSGKPLVDTAVTFDAPAGPLADTDWLKAFQTDGIGDLRFDGFSAGRQTLHYKGLSYSFEVPAYQEQSSAVEVDIRLQGG